METVLPFVNSVHRRNFSRVLYVHDHTKFTKEIVKEIVYGNIFSTSSKDSIFKSFYPAFIWESFSIEKEVVKLFSENISVEYNSDEDSCLKSQILKFFITWKMNTRLREVDYEEFSALNINPFDLEVGFVYPSECGEYKLICDKKAWNDERSLYHLCPDAKYSIVEGRFTKAAR